MGWTALDATSICDAFIELQAGGYRKESTRGRAIRRLVGDL